MRRQVLIAAGFGTLAAVLWALTLGAGQLLPPGFPIFELLSGRYGFQIILLSALLLPTRGTSLMRTARPRTQLLRGLTMLAMPIAFELGLSRVGAGNAWGAIWLGPLFGIVIDRYLSGESTPVSAFLLVMVATVGAILAHGPSVSGTVLGAAVAVCAGLAFGAFLGLTRSLRAERATTGLFWTAVCVTLPSLLFLPMVWVPVTLRTAVGLALMGGLWLLVLLTIDEALRRAPLLLVAPFLLTEIVWARVIYRAPWTRGALVGATFVIICALVKLVRLSSVAAAPATLAVGGSA
jgi:drug/metabolite transporter (DMT)-like permease